MLFSSFQNFEKFRHWYEAWLISRLIINKFTLNNLINCIREDRNPNRTSFVIRSRNTWKKSHNLYWMIWTGCQYIVSGTGFTETDAWFPVSVSFCLEKFTWFVVIIHSRITEYQRKSDRLVRTDSWYFVRPCYILMMFERFSWAYPVSLSTWIKNNIFRAYAWTKRDLWIIAKKYFVMQGSH